MKLAEGSENWILAFENEANRQLQFSSLSSKLNMRDDIVRECLYLCNQNFDQRKYFHCVAQLDDIWMVWNFHQKKTNKENDIIAQVPKFLNLHHVIVKIFQGTPSLRCDCFLYERWVEHLIWFIHIFDSYIHKFMKKMNSYIKWIHLILTASIWETRLCFMSN
jgi:hypothetical protein